MSHNKKKITALKRRIGRLRTEANTIVDTAKTRERLLAGLVVFKDLAIQQAQRTMLAHSMLKLSIPRILKYLLKFSSRYSEAAAYAKRESQKLQAYLCLSESARPMTKEEIITKSGVDAEIVDAVLQEIEVNLPRTNK